MKTSVDLIIPVLNPVPGWSDALTSYYERVRDGLGPDYLLKVIVVDDGSAEPVTGLSEHPMITVVRLPKNQGKGAAIRRGFGHSSATIRAFTDGDFPYQEQSLATVIRTCQPGVHLAVGQRHRDYYVGVPLQRRIISLAFQWAVKMVYRLPVQDTQCGLKAFRAEGIQALLDGRVQRFLFDLEVLRLAAQRQLRIESVEVRSRRDLQTFRISFKVFIQESLNFVRIFFS